MGKMCQDGLLGATDYFFVVNFLKYNQKIIDII